MLKGMNAGFGHPLSPDDLAQLKGMKLDAVRTEIPPHATTNEIGAILHAFVGSSLRPLILLHGEALDETPLAQQARTVAQLGMAKGLTFDLEAANEPDIHDCPPDVMVRRLLAVVDALDAVEFPGQIYGGSVSNPHEDGLAYARAMRWDELPFRVSPAWHLYPVHGDMALWHTGHKDHTPIERLQSDIVQMMETTRGTTHPPAITETGCHTAINTARFHKRYGFLEMHQYTDEAVAELMVAYLTQLAAWGIPRVDYFQWNDGPAKDAYDYEARFGVRDVTGQWKPQGIALAQVGKL